MSDDNNVVFCTLAYNERCRELSRSELLRTYDARASDYKLVILTDDPSYYDDDVAANGNIVVKHIDLKLENYRWFPFSAKMFAVEESIKLFSPPCVIFLDADSVFNRRENFEHFLTLDEGISVIRGKPTTIDNFNSKTQVKERIEFLAKDGELLYVYKEQGFIFRIKSKDNVLRFIEEWKKILDICLEHDFCQFVECIDIGLACQRSGFPLLDLRENKEIYKLLNGGGIFSTYSPYGKGSYVTSLM